MRAVGHMPVETCEMPYGRSACLLVETVGAAAVLAYGEGECRVVGTEVNATHHHLVTSGILTATATALHLDNDVATYEVVVTDEYGNRVSAARLTYILAPRTPETGCTE